MSGMTSVAGCPIAHVDNAGDGDGFPITYVGKDRDGDGFPIHIMLSPFVSSLQVPRRTSQSRGIFNLGSDPSPLAQDDTKSSYQLFVQCLEGEI
jgi:hypothetical protein